MIMNGEHLCCAGPDNQSARIPASELRRIAFDLLTKHGVCRKHANIFADYLVDADACGAHMHGIITLPGYLHKIDGHACKIRPRICVVRETAAFSIVDADRAIGAVSAMYCMEAAISRSKDTGIHTVFCNNANTFGAAYYYAQRAVRQGCIGIALSNAPPAMAPWNGKQKLLGTNPFAIAIPSKTKEPIVFDMATSVAAKSKINQARIAGERIPLGWATDREGYPTTDPEEAIDGLVLPMAGLKGYGLSMTIDILAGVLSGAAFLDRVGKFYSNASEGMNVGQIFVSIEPQIVYGDGFAEKMDEYAETILSSSPMEGLSVTLPGQGRAARREKALRDGIDLPITTLQAIKQCQEQADMNRNRGPYHEP